MARSIVPSPFQQENTLLANIKAKVDADGSASPLLMVYLLQLLAYLLQSLAYLLLLIIYLLQTMVYLLQTMVYLLQNIINNNK